jgi:hypothetical protein
MANKNVFRCPAYEIAGTTHYWRDVRTNLTVGTIESPTETESRWKCVTPFSGLTFLDSEASAVALAEVWVDRVENARY